MQYCNNCFQCTLSHQNCCSNYSKRSSQQYRSTYYRNQRQRCKQVQQLVTSKHVTIKSSPQTNCTETITNRFLLDKKRSHRPTRSTRQKQTYKTHSLTFYSQKCNCRLQSNTHSQSKTCLSCNCRTKRHLSKRVTYLQKEKKYTQPYNCCFSLNIRKRSPRRRQTVSRKSNTFMCRFYKRGRTSTLLTPFQMNTFQSLSVPKTTDRFTKSRQSTISSLCPRVVQRMISNKNQNSKSCCYRPHIKTQYRSHKRLMQAHQRNPLPSFSCRSINNRKILIHKIFSFYKFY